MLVHTVDPDTGADGLSGGWRALVRDILQIIALPAALAFVLSFALAIGNVSGSSMAPLYDDNTILVASRLVKPGRQDVALIRSSALEEEIVKRVIGLPGDRVEIRGGVVYLNEQALEEPYVEYGGGWDMGELTIPEGMLFVLGDNRAVSLDSRSPLLGLVPDGEVEATVLFSFQSPVTFLLPGR